MQLLPVRFAFRVGPGYRGGVSSSDILNIDRCRLSGIASSHRTPHRNNLSDLFHSQAGVSTTRISCIYLFCVRIMSEEVKAVASSTEEVALTAQPSEANPNHDVNIQRLITDGKNPRGIPTAKFIVSLH